MRVDVLTLFPEMFDGVFNASILGKARDKGIVSLQAVNFRQYAGNKHGQVDDTPYGGGGGMVLKPDPIFAAVEELLDKSEQPAFETAVEGIRHEDAEHNADIKTPRIILMCPQGETFTQKKRKSWPKRTILFLYVDIMRVMMSVFESIW